MLKKAICGIALTASVVAASDAARAQRSVEDEPIVRTPEDCVILRRIDRTEVVDDTTILFYMRGGEIYRNSLERTCPDLERVNSFSYRTSTNRLCSVDTITVFDPISNVPGFTCGLGDFRPITAEEAELLVIGPDAPDDGIEVETFDVPVEDADGEN
jgi:hypothetical protein